MSDLEKEKQRLRSYLNPAIAGKNTDIILESLSSGSLHLINNVEAVNDSLYIVKAQAQYLDSRLGGKGVTRPENVGLSDDIFRQLGIEVTNRKQLRDLILKILEIVYGEEFTRATSASSELETYSLQDGDTLKIVFDDREEVEVTFNTSQFTNIGNATAQEVSDAITRELRRLGKTGAAFAKDDGLGFYVNLISTTNGPSSSVKVTGGKAQNILKFDSMRPTSAQASTEWTLTQQPGGVIRATWTGGSNPSVGKVRKNDYVSIFGSAFDASNRGSFTVTTVHGGILNEAYVEWLNPLGIAEVVIQGTSTAILFFNPERKTLNNKTTYAAAYQTEAQVLEVFLPAVTKVVRRERAGAAYLKDDSTPATEGSEGPYLWDKAKGFIIGGEECETTGIVDSNTGMIINVDNSSDFPDSQGSLVFAFGTSKEEGPVPYISRPSNNTLMVNPVYKFKNVHSTGTNISLIALNSVYDPELDGSDYPFYITDVISGRVYAEELIRLVMATGIRLIVTILFPGDEGLGRWNTPFSDKVRVWGPDEL